MLRQFFASARWPVRRRQLGYRHAVTIRRGRNEIDCIARTSRQRQRRLGDNALIDNRVSCTWRLELSDARTCVHRIDVGRGAAAEATQFRRHIDERRLAGEQMLRQLDWQLVTEQLHQRARAGTTLCVARPQHLQRWQSPGLRPVTTSIRRNHRVEHVWLLIEGDCLFGENCQQFLRR